MVAALVGPHVTRAQEPTAMPAPVETDTPTATQTATAALTAVATETSAPVVTPLPTEPPTSAVTPTIENVGQFGIVSARTQIALHFCSRWTTDFGELSRAIQRPETFWKPPDCGPAGANCKAEFPPG